MGWMSPQDLYEDRKRWLNTPHEHHEALLGLMTKLFPDFNLDGVHCYLCEGTKPYVVINIADSKPMMCMGYAELEDGEIFFSCHDITD